MMYNLGQLFGSAGISAHITCLLADDGQDLFTDPSMVFANDRHVRVAVGLYERVKVNKYGEEVPQGRPIFPAPGVRGTLGEHVQDDIQDDSQDYYEACDAGGSYFGSNPMFLRRRWLQKLNINVQVLNANLVTMCTL
jgi:hypothetical protein